jgi:hypothetical protein
MYGFQTVRDHRSRLVALALDLRLCPAAILKAPKLPFLQRAAWGEGQKAATFVRFI